LIHPSAIIDETAEIADDVSIGPFSVIGPDVTIGRGTSIASHVVIKQSTRIGEDPQDKKYAGEETYLEIGDRNVIREYVTLNRGTSQDAVTTRIGNDNLLMAYTHVAHDCQVGNHTILANAASLGGHVHVQDWAILGGFTIVHQFCRIGAHCFAAMGSAIAKDVLPFTMLGGQPAKPHGINKEGLKRRGFSEQQLKNILHVYKLIYKSGMPLEQAKTELAELAQKNDDAALISEFLDSCTRSIIR